jgi:hypothetical protein
LSASASVRGPYPTTRLSPKTNASPDSKCGPTPSDPGRPSANPCPVNQSAAVSDSFRRGSNRMCESIARPSAVANPRFIAYTMSGESGRCASTATSPPASTIACRSESHCFSASSGSGWSWVDMYGLIT